MRIIKLFRRHVGDAPHYRVSLRYLSARRIFVFTEPEVRHHPTRCSINLLLQEKDICGLEVSVQDSVRVGVFDGIEYVSKNVYDLLRA